MGKYSVRYLLIQILFQGFSRKDVFVPIYFFPLGH